MSQIIKDMTEITRCGVQYRIDYLTPMGLKACHASYLTEICRTPGISQDGLARLICLNKSNVARQAAVLEEEGFTPAPPPLPTSASWSSTPPKRPSPCCRRSPIS